MNFDFFFKLAYAVGFIWMIKSIIKMCLFGIIFDEEFNNGVGIIAIIAIIHILINCATYFQNIFPLVK